LDGDELKNLILKSRDNVLEWIASHSSINLSETELNTIIEIIYDSMTTDNNEIESEVASIIDGLVTSFNIIGDSKPITDPDNYKGELYSLCKDYFDGYIEYSL
jgi:hypothetical protein